MAQLFPDISEVLEEDKKNEGNQDVIENLEEILSNIDRETPFEFEFFTGEKNKKIDQFIQSAALSLDNLEFLDFLQSDQGKQIFIENKLKINVEIGNIYDDNTDTNEGILDFIFNQQNLVTGNIPYNFTCGNSCKNYFNWLITGFDSYENAKLDVLTFKNAKYLFYRFNNILSESNVPIKKIKHSTVTDDFIAAEEIQNRNWQYYIEQVIEFCHNKEIEKTIRTLQSNLLFDTVINITEAKQSYNTFFDTVAQSFHLKIEKIPFEEKEKIREDFERENFFAEYLIQDLDHWVSFFFDKGRFPESQELVMLPQPKIPDFVRTQIALSPNDIYKKVSSTNAKELVSIRALAALNFYIGGDKDISREAMEEFVRNSTFQVLTNESNKVVIAFDKTGFLVIDLLEQFVKLEQELYKDSETLSKNLDKTIN